MGMVVRTNMAAINANNSLAQAAKAQQNGMQKLASGFKINKAADDASGLAISEKMKNQIKALDTAKDNCEDGANMIQTAEGYMTETHEILNRMTELAEKSANGVLANEDRDALQKEMDELCGEIDRIASTANFNGQKLLDGSQGGTDSVKLFADKFSKRIDYYGPVANGQSGGVFDIDGLGAGKYTVSTAAAMSGNNTATMTVTYLNSAGVTMSREIKLQVKDGDKIFLASGETSGKSAMGVSLGNATAATKDRVLTYNAQDDKWYDQDGKAETGIKTDFNTSLTAGKELTFKEGINLQIGESSTKADRLNVSMNSFHTDTMFKGLKGFVNQTNDNDNADATSTVKIIEGNSSSTYTKAVSIDISDKDAASAAADAIRQVSNFVSDERGKLGAQQNRIEHTVNTLTTASENTSASNSRIRDTDMAKEMMAYTSKNVIAQAAQSMLAQANSQPQNVLSLLQ